MLAQAFLLGGHCRIGMEDAVYLEKGVKCNGNRELVEKAVSIITTLGGKVASVSEAREILQLPPVGTCMGSYMDAPRIATEE